MGVVTDGSVRDLDEVRALGFQFAAAHVSVSHAYVHMVDFGLPIKVGGLWVKPGDLIHADQHGAVTIPPEIAGDPGGRRQGGGRRAQDHLGLPVADFSADTLKDLYKQIRPGTYRLIREGGGGGGMSREWRRRRRGLHPGGVREKGN